MTVFSVNSTSFAATESSIITLKEAAQIARASLKGAGIGASIGVTAAAFIPEPPPQENPFPSTQQFYGERGMLTKYAVITLCTTTGFLLGTAYGTCQVAFRQLANQSPQWDDLSHSTNMV